MIGVMGRMDCFHEGHEGTLSGGESITRMVGHPHPSPLPEGEGSVDRRLWGGREVWGKVAVGVVGELDEAGAVGVHYVYLVVAIPATPDVD